MATTVGNLAVILSANTNKYSSGLRRAGTDTQRFSVSVTRSIGSVFSTVSRLGTLVAGGGAIAMLVTLRENSTLRSPRITR